MFHSGTLQGGQTVLFLEKWLVLMFVSHAIVVTLYVRPSEIVELVLFRVKRGFFVCGFGSKIVFLDSERGKGRYARIPS